VHVDKEETVMGEPLTRQAEGEAEQFPPPPSERELVVIVAPDARIRASEDGITSLAGADISGLVDVLGAENIALVPLFGMSEEQQAAKASLLAARGAENVPDLSVYYRVRAEESRLEELAERLRAEPVVEAAYVKPGAEPASAPAVAAPGEVAPAATPDFVGRQAGVIPSTQPTPPRARSLSEPGRRHPVHTAVTTVRTAPGSNSPTSVAA
jgi:hypothetical protein